MAEFPTLGPLERRVLEFFWDGGEQTVADIQGRFRPEEYAYTTVLTVVTRLHGKGLLERTHEGRAYRYRPAIARDAFLAQASAALMRTFAREYGPTAVAHFADGVGLLPLGDRRRLAARLREILEDEQDM